MELSLSLPVPGLGFADQIEFARRAEDAGFTTAWVAETSGPDAFVLAAAVAAATNLKLGTGVVPVYTRTPMALAMATAGAAHASNNRFTLGIGSSSHTIVQDWGGVPFEKPLTRVKETTELLRRLLAGEKVTYDGETIHVKNLRIGMPPTAPVPIFVAALNAGMLRLAGEIGDGVWINMVGEENMHLVMGAYTEGAKAAGRETGPVVCRMQTWLGDPDGAYGLVRGAMAAYVATPVYNKFFSWIGFADEAAAVKDAFGRGDRAATAAAMSDGLVRQIVSAGQPEEIAERFARYAEAGVTDACVQPLAMSAEVAFATVDSVRKAWERVAR